MFLPRFFKVFAVCMFGLNQRSPLLEPVLRISNSLSHRQTLLTCPSLLSTEQLSALACPPGACGRLARGQGANAGTPILTLKVCSLKASVEGFLYFPQCAFCPSLLLTGYFIEKKLHFGVVCFINISFSFYESCLRCHIRTIHLAQIAKVFLLVFL